MILKNAKIKLASMRKALSGVPAIRRIHHELKGAMDMVLSRKEKGMPGDLIISDYPLHLKPGEKVRVKTLEQIQKTLDSRMKYQGLSFTPSQIQYCGETYTVLKRLEKAFDEKKGKLFRIKDTVLLEGVSCDGLAALEAEWYGCDRLCLLFWKEIWLERIQKE